MLRRLDACIFSPPARSVHCSLDGRQKCGRWAHHQATTCIAVSRLHCMKWTYWHDTVCVLLVAALNCCCRCLGRSCSKACGPPGSPRIVCSVSGIRHALADDACRLIGGHLLELTWWQSSSLICSHAPFPLKATCCREDTGQGHCKVAKNLEWLGS